MVDVKATIHCPIADTRKWIARDWDARTSYTVTNEWMNVQVRRIAIGCGLIFETDLLDWHIHHIKLNLVVQMYHRANIERPRLERKRDRSTSTSYWHHLFAEMLIPVHGTSTILKQDSRTIDRRRSMFRDLRNDWMCRLVYRTAMNCSLPLAPPSRIN